MPDWVVTVWQGTTEIDQWLIENKAHAEAVREAGHDVMAVYGERHYWMVTEDLFAPTPSVSSSGEPARRKRQSDRGRVARSGPSGVVNLD